MARLPPVLVVFWDGFECGGKFFQPGRKSRVNSPAPERVALFVGTVGPRYEQLHRRYTDEDDPFPFTLDAVGSELAERIAGRIEKIIGAQSKAAGLSISNRYSPVIAAGRSLSNTPVLAAAKGTLWHHAYPSAMMRPIKSVSGVIGLGSGVKTTLIAVTSVTCARPAAVGRGRSVQSRLCHSLEPTAAVIRQRLRLATFRLPALLVDTELA